MRHRRLTPILLAILVLPSMADEPKKAKGPANRLAKETSPYLLLHANNPVDWYPWGPEAFAKAKAENKPIFLSVGYSSCYWCHVMERECFMNDQIAKLINDKFVAIKVDREERPDVDQVYMTAIQAFSGGGGGWPMSVFMTPDGRPFYGGTYFPPAEFTGLLNGVADAWRDQRAEVEKDANQASDIVRKTTERTSKAGRVPLTRLVADKGVPELLDQFDPEFGGFNFNPERPKRPKFPEPVNLLYLLDQDRRNPASGARAMVDKTLDPMARGGIRDHLAGGYHRYSTVRDWSVPHFEKMLYDNAQLAEAHVLAFERTGDPRWKAEAEATFAFIARTMTLPEGLFCSALDAESEAEEGKSYVWSKDEVAKVLGSPSDYALFASAYGLDTKPNFEGGRYVLLEPKILDPTLKAKLAPMVAKLLAVRDKRPAPMLDDKVLTSWNALMITAYAEGYRVFKDDRYKLAASKAADALLATMRTTEGRLLRTSRGGKAKLAAYLEDYSFLTYALLRLHASTGDLVRLAQAKSLADRMIADFADPVDGGFFYTAGDHETLLARPKDPFDGAVPGANGVAIRALIALGNATKEPRYLDVAGKALDAFSSSLSTRPAASPLMLLGLAEYLDARPAAKAEGSLDVPLPGAPGAVTVEAKLARAGAVAPGAEFEVEVTLVVKKGYHIFANPAGSDDVIPTVLALAPGSPAKLVAITYSKGEVKVLAANGPGKVSVYEGKTTLSARIKLPDDAEPGELTVNLRLRSQACDDRACLAPRTENLAVKVEVKAR